MAKIKQFAGTIGLHLDTFRLLHMIISNRCKISGHIVPYICNSLAVNAWNDTPANTVDFTSLANVKSLDFGWAALFPYAGPSTFENDDRYWDSLTL